MKSLKRIVIFNSMRDYKDYSKMKQEDVEYLIKRRYKDASIYLRRICASDLIENSKKKINEG